MSTPNARSKALLESEGYVVEIVERYNAWAQVRSDLFGFADLLAVKPGETRAVQSTTDSNLAARRKKLAASPIVPTCIAAGWKIKIHGWKKRGRTWGVRREQVKRTELLEVEK